MNTCPYCTTHVQPYSHTCPQCGSRLQSCQLAVGTVLDHKYHVQKVLGQGGFGITYLANDPTLQRRVAIKELFPDGSSRELDGSFVPPASSLDFLETKKRFIDEARVLAQFNHPSIVRIFDVFAANDTAYLVMEALDGETLGSRIQRLGAMSEKVVEYIAQELCEALEVVHAGGLLHRDIKPENVYLTNDKRVVLIDFGSARTFKSGQVMQHTQLVTPGYAAPEQYATEAKFGAYTDVYGVAATLYFALTGQAPLSSSDRILTGKEISLPSSVSQTLRTAIIAGLQIRIDARPQTAREFLQRLDSDSHVSLGRIPTGQNSITPMLQVTPNVKEITLKNGSPLITTKRVEINEIGSRNGTVTTYLLSDILKLWITTDGWAVSSAEGKSPPTDFFWIAGSIMFVGGLPVLSFRFYEFFAVIAIFCFILVLLGWLGTSRLNNHYIYYLVAEFSPRGDPDLMQLPKRFLLYSSENQREVQNLMSEINFYKQN